MIYVVAGTLYVLGAFLMYIIADEEDEGDMRARPYYAVFWPLVVVFWATDRLLNYFRE
jgi:hypothetical protein